MSTAVTLQDEAEAKQAVAKLRSDEEPENWVVWGHVNNDPNLVQLVGSGAGGLEELTEKLNDNGVFYGLYRTTEQFDLSVNVKFVYIYFVGSGVPALKRGKIAVVQSSVKNFLDPSHITLETGNIAEINDEKVKFMLGKNSGTNTSVLETADTSNMQVRNFSGRVDTMNKSSTGTTRESKFKFQGLDAAQKGSDIKVAEDLLQAIQDVRSDNSPLKWCLASWDKNDPKLELQLNGTGEDSVSEMWEKTTEDKVYYGFVRVVDYIDENPTVKFAFVYYIGPKVNAVKRGKLTPAKGAVNAVFAPFQVDFDTDTPSQITDEVIHDKVAATSGSKSHVKAVAK
eukprot:Lithocolla_globosa_v1_NODE_3467_length_1661_cov_163.313200.p1 type:complete len:340 gc:universal NODE_3467_length_1661_cov_163.313200:582-1601(+)